MSRQHFVTALMKYTDSVLPDYNNYVVEILVEME